MTSFRFSRGKHWTNLLKPLNLARQPARILLIGLTALGIIKLENERYYNARLIEERMVKGQARICWDHPGMASSHCISGD